MSDLYRFTENGITRDHAWGTQAEAEQFAALNGYLIERISEDDPVGKAAEHLDDMLARS